jgi:hypothetical protein
MIRQRLLWKVIGRRLTERLLRAGWIEPIRADRGIFYGQRDVHLALKRVQREGWRIDGHARNGFRSATTKVRNPTPEDVIANFSLDL